MSAFILGIHHFTNASKVIARKVFLFERILFPLAHGLAGLPVLLELHGNYPVPWLDGWIYSMHNLCLFAKTSSIGRAGSY
jgi:hypothetical protein